MLIKNLLKNINHVNSYVFQITKNCIEEENLNMTQEIGNNT